MNSHSPSAARRAAPPRRLPARSTTAVAVLAALTGLAGSDALARTPEEIRAEIERLERALQQSRQELQQGQGDAAAPAGEATTPAPASAALGAVTISGKGKTNVVEALKDVPKSVSAVDGQELERLGATSVTDVLRRIGNVNFNYGNPRTGSLTLRGLTTGSSDAIDPSVGLVFDGVSLGYSPIANGAVYIDVDTVDVTRGPQGTTGGKNSSVGQIEVRTRAPSFTPEARGSVTLGQNNTVKTVGVVGGPVIDGLLAWRASFLREQADGEYQNSFPDLRGRSSYPNTDRTYARVQFLLTPTPDLRARVSVEHQPRGGEYVNGLTVKKEQPTQYSDGAPISQTTLNASPRSRLNRGLFTQYGSFSADDYYNDPIALDNNGSIITGSRAVTANVDWAPPGPWSLRSITGWRDHFFSAANDEGTPFDITKSGGYITTYRQVSQELRLAYENPDLAKAVTGLYYFASDNESLSRTRYGNDAGAWFATGNGTAGNLQYGTLAFDAAGRDLLRDSLNNLYKGQNASVDNKSAAWYGNVEWKLKDRLSLVTGLRLGYESRQTTQYSNVLDQGVGSALNPVAVNTLQLGGFASNASGALAANNSAAQLSLADQVANRYFGTAVTGTPGQAYNSLTAAQKAQVAASKAVRAAQITGLFLPQGAEPWKGQVRTAHLSLVNRFEGELTGYATVQYGEKAGISQINGTAASGGISALVRPEKTTSYELGLRTALLDKTLHLNADVFLSDIRDFQQTVSYLDPTLTALNGTPTYSSGPGNVAKVRVQGLEFDAAYSGLTNATLRVSGAYNDARYRDYRFAAIPAEMNPAGLPGFRDASGQTLPNAPKFTTNIAADYRLPVGNDKLLHTSANYRWTSRYNNDSALSEYGWVGAYGLLDLGIGLGSADGTFDITLLVNNAFDKNAHNIGWTSYTPGSSRWFGLVFSAKL